ncbi:MAG: hypothetical protein E7307_09545 [Butyrivibrio sp.]|nr:hypothetical protein [Butyrivibrio sp.]
MGDFLKELMADDIKEAELRGEKRGEKRGADKMLIELVHDGVLDINVAAKRAKKSMKKFREELEMAYPTK